MSVYKRSDSDFYSYDFRLDGVRYSGSTFCTDEKEARAFENFIRSEAMALDGLCRHVLRKARRRVPRTPRASDGYVYMLRAGYFIKIGHSREPASRIDHLKTANPEEIHLLCCIPGEWFFMCGKLKMFIGRMMEKLDAEQARPRHELPRRSREVDKPALQEIGL